MDNGQRLTDALSMAGADYDVALAPVFANVNGVNKECWFHPVLTPTHARYGRDYHPVSGIVRGQRMAKARYIANEYSVALSAEPGGRGSATARGEVRAAAGGATALSARGCRGATSAPGAAPT